MPDLGLSLKAVSRGHYYLPRTGRLLLTFCLLSCITPQALAAPNVYIKPGSIYSSIISPCPGDTVQIGFELCNDNQYYTPPGRIILGVESTASNPTLDRFATGGVMDPNTWIMVGSGGVINPPIMNWDQAVVNGGHAQGGVAYTGINCMTSRPVVYNVTLPIAGYNYGTSYRIHIGVSDDNQSPDGDANSVVRYQIPFTSCLPQNGQRSISKRVEGTAAQDDLMLYWIDYNVVNSTTIVVRDPIPANTTFVSASGGGTYSGGVVTWNLGDANAASTPPYVKKGTLWVLVRVNSGASGTLSNAATVTTTQGSSISNTVSSTVGAGMNLSLYKEQLDDAGVSPINQAYHGDTVTYRMNFTLSGLGLKCFDSLDAMSGSYNGPASPRAGRPWPRTTTAPPGPTGRWTRTRRGTNI